MRRGFHVRYWVAAAVLAGALLGGGLLGTRIGRSQEAVPFFVASAEEAAPGGRVSFENGFTPIVQRVVPAVVNVFSERVVRSNTQASPFFDNPFFRDFFGDRGPFNVPRERSERSLGSGVIVSPEGYILTNSHVVQGSTGIRVGLADKRELNGRIVGADPKTDIAVIRVDERNLPVLTLGDATKVAVGDFVLAVGNPFGVGQTVTQGIVSATGRRGLNIEQYEDFIQTDAAINPGNSGGALVNVRGELIGINTAILTGGGGNQGVGFAVPSNMARHIMEQILKHGRVIRGYLGVAIQDVTEPMAQAFGMKEARGVVVSDVTQGGPADRAGLKRGDVILQVNGEPAVDSAGVSLRIAQTAPGGKARLRILRDNREQEITATLGELPAERERTQGGPPEESGQARLGISVQELTPAIARELGLPRGTAGVLVSDVQPGSAAAEAGLQRGDVIQEVNRRPVRSVADFRRAAGGRDGQPVLLLVNRGGSTIYVTIERR
ncbi:MAG: DegQ family serine endoprotease [Bryobacterales bacterium]|nr:DegQ family serine endoprotease [Bryobacterales bacterium]